MCNSVKIVSERVVSADLVDLLVEDVEKDLVREVVRLLYGESTN